MYGKKDRYRPLKDKQVGAPTVPSAVNRGSTEFEDFRGY
jgi:hypothetical protein